MNEFITIQEEMHICKESLYCTCSILGFEPDENCPRHSGGDWPPRCETCGRFMKWLKNES